MIWKEIRTAYEEDGVLFVDAWKTEDDNEEGTVIAKIFREGSSARITYLDERAKDDTYAQEVINEVIQHHGLTIMVLDEVSMLDDLSSINDKQDFTGIIVGDTTI